MDELEEELRQSDKADFVARLARFREVMDWLDVPETGLSFGPDWESVAAFNEGRFSYVNGFWLSAIVMSQTSVERHIAWRLSVTGEGKSESMTAKQLLDAALRQRLIDETQRQTFSRLRTMRNDFAHFRIESRFWKTAFAIHEPLQGEEYTREVNINLVLQADAREAVQIATAYFLSAGFRDRILDPTPI